MEQKIRLPISGQEGSTVNQALQTPYRVGEIIAFGGYDWIVLEIGREKTLIITKDIIEKRAYHVAYQDITWETCTLRAYINGEFYNRFCNSDKKRIAKVRNNNPNNEYLTYGGNIRNTPGGNPTDDFVFLLSIGEAKDYFHTTDRSAEDTDGDKEKSKKQLSWGPASYPQSDVLIAAYAGKPWRWWLRSPGFVSNHAAYVHDGGYVNVYGYNVLNAYAGVRPALYLWNQ